MNAQRKKAPPCGELDGALNGSTEKNSYSAAGATASPALRSTKDSPFCWQSKIALKLITETLEESGHATSARSVYLALTELASDAQSDTFQVRKALIAHRSSVSVSTVSRLLPKLEELGLIKIERASVGAGSSGTIKAPNFYYLLPIGNGDATSIGHGRHKPSNPDRVEESKKNLRTRHGHEDKAHAHASRASATAPAPSPEGLEELSDDERAIVTAYNATLVPLGWKRLNKITAAVLDLLPRNSPDEWRDFFESIANAPRDQWPHHRTFVRLHWDNY